MIRRTAVVLVALLVSSAAQSEFFTYQQWLALPLSSRALYIAGVYDASTADGKFIDTFVVNAPLRSVGTQWLHFKNCLYHSQMTTFQIAANMADFAKDKPELQTGSVQYVLAQYLAASCGEPPTK